MTAPSDHAIAWSPRDLTTSIDSVPVPSRDLPPPRTPQNEEHQKPWRLGLDEALQLALENSKVVRRLPTPAPRISVITRFGPETDVQVTGWDQGAHSGRLLPPVRRAGAISTRELLEDVEWNAAEAVRWNPGVSTWYDPAIRRTEIERALARFDASFEANVFWSRAETPVSSTLQGGLSGMARDAIVADAAAGNLRLMQPTTWGGSIGLGYNTTYELSNSPFQTISPAWSPNFEVWARQPLLRGRGRNFNLAPVVIARLGSDQSLWELKGSLLALVRSIVQAYWELYAARVSLESIDKAVILAERALQLEESRLKTGHAIRGDVGQAFNRMNYFRQQRVRAVASVLESELQLRNLLGLPPSDGRQIIAADTPSTAPLAIDWQQTLGTALNRRPDIAQQRLVVRIHELQLLQAQNALAPQLDVAALYRVNGLGDELDAALRLLGDNQFTDWQIGLTMQVPLGFRRARADVQREELELERQHAYLQETVHQAGHLLANIVTELDTVFLEYDAADKQVQGAKSWLDGAKVRFENPPDNLPHVLALDQYFQAMTVWVSARADMAVRLARFNTQLAVLEEAQGTLLEARGIQLLDDPCLVVQRSNNRVAAGMGHRLPSQPPALTLEPPSGGRSSEWEASDPQRDPVRPCDEREPASTIDQSPEFKPAERTVSSPRPSRLGRTEHLVATGTASKRADGWRRASSR